MWHGSRVVRDGALRRRRDRIALGGFVLLASCGPVPVGPVRDLLQLVETPRELGVEELEGWQRPALVLGTTSSVAGSGTGTVPPSGTLVVSLALPAEWPIGVSPRVSAVTSVGDALRLQQPAVRMGPAPTAVLTFERGEVGREVRWQLVATAERVADVQVTTRPVRIPPRAHLEVALALARHGCAALPPTDVRIDVVTERGARPIVRRRLDPTRDCLRWWPVAASLEAFGHREVRFRFRARPARAPDRGRPVRAVFGAPLLVSTGTAAPRPPNVILVSLDTLGAKHLGAYGSPHPTSPALDRLARGGTVFTHAVAHYPSTAASHMSLFTSRLVAAHGVRGMTDRLPAGLPTLAEALRRGGYLTVAVTENATLARSLGFARGFHAYREFGTPTRATPGRVRETFREALRWLRRAPPEPFFLFLHTYEVHGPYRPSAGHLRLVRPNALPQRLPRFERRKREDWEWLYEAEIRFLDRLVGRLLASLVREGLLARSVLVVTADHGEAFGEHGHWAHGTMVYDEVMRVPLVFHGAGIPPGRRVDARIGLVDVMPTILELAGLPAPASLDGRALTAALRGGTLTPRPVFAELRGRLGPNPERPEEDYRAVWLGDDKVIHHVHRDTWQVFDLARDPEERDDVAASAAETLARGRRLLAGYADVTVATDTAAPPALDPALTPDAIRKLRALGYLE
jgi:arylsulfatase A-like enzyme